MLKFNEALCDKIYFYIREKKSALPFTKKFTVEMALPFAKNRMIRI